MPDQQQRKKNNSATTTIDASTKRRPLDFLHKTAAARNAASVATGVLTRKLTGK